MLQFVVSYCEPSFEDRSLAEGSQTLHFYFLLFYFLTEDTISYMDCYFFCPSFVCILQHFQLFYLLYTLLATHFPHSYSAVVNNKFYTKCLRIYKPLYMKLGHGGGF